MCSDLNLHTPRRRELIAALLITLVLMAGRAAEVKSTYGQQIVAAVLMGEAWGEGEIGMTAVAEVIRNRADKAGKSPLQIVLKKGEFACLNNSTPAALYRKFYRIREYQMALRIAKTCYNTPELLPNVTRGATFFDHKQNAPSWLCDVRPVSTIGNHTFYVLKSQVPPKGNDFVRAKGELARGFETGQKAADKKINQSQASAQ